MISREEVQERARNIRVIALDIDGTSMNNQSEITPYTRTVIQRLVDCGYLIVPASGRGFSGLCEQILGVKGIRYVISANGAVITDGETGERIDIYLMPCELSVSLIRDMLRTDTCVYVHQNDPEGTHVFACGDGDFYEEHYRLKGWPGKEALMGMEFPDYLRKDGRDIVKIGIWFENEEKLAEAEVFIRKKYPAVSAFRVANYELEISDSRASKGNALQNLCERIGVVPWQVCAIGDNGNDVLMIQYAGLGIAMGNAIESVKAQADYIAGLNDEDGAAKFFEDFFLSIVS